METDGCMQERNEAIFRQLYASYASAVYQRLYDRCMDKQLARDTLKDVFKLAYDWVQHMDAPDNTAQWLNQLADEGLQKRLLAQKCANSPKQAGQPPVQSSDCVQEQHLHLELTDAADDARRAIAYVRERGLREHSSPAKHEKGYAALACLLAILLIISVWYVAGMLMQKGMLPHIDLGYTWFSTNVFALF